MNILVIGNGFDLAHELPTKYKDFLEFVKVIKQALSKGKLSGIDWGKTDTKVKNFLISDKGKVQSKFFSNSQMWEGLINNNIWIDYFLQNPMYQKENWIDFEGEISRVIRSLDYDMRNGIDRGATLDDEIYMTLSNDILELYVEKYSDITFKVLRNLLLDNLNKLIRALEIYLCEYVEKIEIQKKSPDIEDLKIDHVLSFNYTNTFSKLYKITNRIGETDADSFDYIHGKADINNTIELNNMVLGIDEYLSGDRKNKDIDFIAFKKFYQRIHKETGCKYKEWVDEIREDYAEYQYGLSKSKKDFPKHPKHNLYIFGHSLSQTDGDILRDLILNDNVHTTIFYHNKDVMGQQIANLVKVIGQDELIRRNGGKDKLIEFKPQQKMIPINN